MASANQKIYDRTIRRAIGIERFKKGEVARILALLDEADKDLRRRFAERMDLIRVRGEDAGPVTTARFKSLIRAINKTRTDVMRAMQEENRDGMVRLGLDEIEWQAEVISKTVPVVVDVATPTYTDVLAASTSRPFQGAVLRDWWRGVARAERDRLTRAVRLGVVEGQTTDEIVRRIFGTPSMDFEDGEIFKTRHNAEAVVRTALNHVQNKSKEMFYDANSDIIKELRWTSVLDGRTTPICQSRDGEVYPVDEGPRPPAHFNCRSVMVPVLDGDLIVGQRPSVTDTRTREEREIDFRADAKERVGDERWSEMNRKQRDRLIGKVRKEWAEENITRVPATETYPTWLARQRAEFQDEVLGPTRAKLFRDGELPLTAFVDQKSGKPWTLAQLRRREREAYALANID